MSFFHDDPADLDALVRRATSRVRLSEGLIEKDYWVTHTLWALHQQGWEVWFKGGTSLSKGFGIIERFSEDLDLKIDPGTVPGLSAVTDWERDSTRAKRAREAFFRGLVNALNIPGVPRIALAPDPDPHWRSGEVRVEYPRLYQLGPEIKPFVSLEIGDARVRPFVACDLSAFVHDDPSTALASFDDNRPRGVRCLHPLVTLLEKLDAIQKRALDGTQDPAKFVRHYEDAASIIAKARGLPPLADYADVRALKDEMLREKQIWPLLRPNAPALALHPGARTDAIRQAYDAIAGMFWGGRTPLDDVCGAIRQWLRDTFE